MYVGGQCDVVVAVPKLKQVLTIRVEKRTCDMLGCVVGWNHTLRRQPLGCDLEDTSNVDGWQRYLIF